MFSLGCETAPPRHPPESLGSPGCGPVSFFLPYRRRLFPSLSPWWSSIAPPTFTEENTKIIWSVRSSTDPCPRSGPETTGVGTRPLSTDSLPFFYMGHSNGILTCYCSTNLTAELILKCMIMGTGEVVQLRSELLKAVTCLVFVQSESVNISELNC